MATATDGEVNGCIFHWKIQNLSHCWWMEKCQGIDSPAFIADELEGTKWSLSLYPMGYSDSSEQYIGLFVNREKDCSGPTNIEVYCGVEFLDKNGSIFQKRSPLKQNFKKNEIRGWARSLDREAVFVARKELYLPEDSLTLQFTLCSHEKPIRPKHLYARTIFTVNRRSFVWGIDQTSTPETKHEKRYEDNLISFKLVFNKQRVELKLDEVSFDDSLRWVSFTVSAIDLHKKKEICGIQEYSPSDLRDKPLLQLPYPEIAMENPSQYLIADSLSLEFAFLTVQCTNSRKNFTKFEHDVETGEHPGSRCLADCLESMYTEENFADAEIHTANKSFKVHRAILSARSPVFNRMFHTDMLENRSGYVNLTDFDDHTVEQMLFFMYTDTVKDLGLQNVGELYKIANKYDMKSLKRSCSYFLKDNLCPIKVCDILTLAELHNDTDLKNSVIEYIMGLNKKFFKTQEWKDFMNKDFKLTIEVLYKKVFWEKNETFQCHW